MSILWRILEMELNMYMGGKLEGHYNGKERDESGMDNGF
jgi:hypothetical protein